MNPIIEDLQLVGEYRGFEEYYPRTRDRGDIAVLKSSVNDLIILDKDPGIDYSAQPAFEPSATYEDITRRKKRIASYFHGQSYLDIGAANGNMLKSCAEIFDIVEGVEPNYEMSKHIPFMTYDSIEELEPDKYSMVTMYHVLEHIPNPIEFLSRVRESMSTGGILIIEVPHAKDALLTYYDLEEFKAFTFWSQHLILYTRDVLCKILREAGFTSETTFGDQRYNLSNHMYWLKERKPGGQYKFRMRAPQLESKYTLWLEGRDMTDTIVAIGVKK